ncbi:polysaccharide deacetylase family protein [Ferruginibacter albus]|uniref:polysaccharide deacetylase family protein n=1 Tax=Ferruginibacter albus TaxID=2875540 RepID=UPI001CC5D12D|nr:polysaccharide deacetylase family protein [Ferruginibacter albus]UAY52753.1 polysaccharide deacetylase family protein [Ferruginibacter albus]
MFYFIKTPFWLKKIYKGCIWNINSVDDKTIYLTFDDGPHPTVTPFVLDELSKYNAKGTFFCIGKNVELYTVVYNRLLTEGHATGNHTFNHLNGWKTNDETYIRNITMAEEFIKNDLFRPPYGKIKRKQIKSLTKENHRYRIIMWSVLSGDFDKNLSVEQCLKNVLQNTKNGDIVVFHDSEKAFEKIKYALPKVLEHFSNKGYKFKKIT